MTQPERVNPAPQPVGDVVATQVRKYRLRREWSIRQLAEECAKLGAPQLTSASLGNIERGQDQDAKRKRRDVTVEELMVLARALGVAPLLLMVPLEGGRPQVEMVPGEPWLVWDAAKWITGEAYPEGEVETFFAVPVQLNREYQRLEDRYVFLMADDLFASSSDAEVAARKDEKERIKYRVLALRAEMERRGMPLPPLEPVFPELAKTRHTRLDLGTAEQLAAEGALRELDPRGPGRGRVMKPGEPTKLQEALERGRKFTEEFYAKEDDK